MSPVIDCLFVYAFGTGTVMSNMLAANSAKSGLAKASGGAGAEAGMSSQKKQPAKLAAPKVTSPPTPKEKGLWKRARLLP